MPCPRWSPHPGEYPVWSLRCAAVMGRKTGKYQVLHWSLSPPVLAVPSAQSTWALTLQHLSRDFFPDSGTIAGSLGWWRCQCELQDVLVGKGPGSVFPSLQVSVSFISLPQWPHYSNEDPHGDSRQPALVQWEPNTQ